MYFVERIFFVEMYVNFTYVLSFSSHFDCFFVLKSVFFAVKIPKRKQC